MSDVPPSIRLEDHIESVAESVEDPKTMCREAECNKGSLLGEVPRVSGALLKDASCSAQASGIMLKFVDGMYIHRLTYRNK